MGSLFLMMMMMVVAVEAKRQWYEFMMFTSKNRLLENLCTHAFAITHMCIEFENEGGTFTHTSEYMETYKRERFMRKVIARKMRVKKRSERGRNQMNERTTKIYDAYVKSNQMRMSHKKKKKKTTKKSNEQHTRNNT